MTAVESFFQARCSGTALDSVQLKSDRVTFRKDLISHGEPPATQLREFEFSHVFPPQSENQDLLELIVPELVDRFESGLNICCVAYGPKECEKSDVLFGKLDEEETLKGESKDVVQAGLCVAMIDALFDSPSADDWAVFLSVLEIGEQKLSDLLVEGPKVTKPSVIRQPDGSFTASNLTSCQVDTETHAESLLFDALSRKQMRNSHILATLIVEIPEPDGATRRACSFLELDFALQSSVTALGRVLASLNANQPQAQIPFGKSLLTKLLSSRVDNDCFTNFLCCGDVSQSNEDSISQLVQVCEFSAQLRPESEGERTTKTTKPPYDTEGTATQIKLQISRLRKENARLRKSFVLLREESEKRIVAAYEKLSAYDGTVAKQGMLDFSECIQSFQPIELPTNLNGEGSQKRSSLVTTLAEPKSTKGHPQQRRQSRSGRRVSLANLTESSDSSLSGYGTLTSPVAAHVVSQRVLNKLADTTRQNFEMKRAIERLNNDRTAREAARNDRVAEIHERLVDAEEQIQLEKQKASEIRENFELQIQSERQKMRALTCEAVVRTARRVASASELCRAPPQSTEEEDSENSLVVLSVAKKRNRQEAIAFRKRCEARCRQLRQQFQLKETQLSSEVAKLQQENERLMDAMQKVCSHSSTHTGNMSGVIDQLVRIVDRIQSGSYPVLTKHSGVSFSIPHTELQKIATLIRNQCDAAPVDASLSEHTFNNILPLMEQSARTVTHISVSLREFIARQVAIDTAHSNKNTTKHETPTDLDSAETEIQHAFFHEAVTLEEVDGKH
ncbi:MAG: hypothetical protein MHM6MM_003367 [Cercozoa sp. M6MM]